MNGMPGNFNAPKVPLASAAADDDARVRQRATDAAVKFEAFFIKQMMSQMRQSAHSLSGESDNARHGQEMMDIADGMVADTLASQRAFGIADLMLKQVLPAALAKS